MDYGFEDSLPSDHIYQHAFVPPAASQPVQDDYLWLEKYLPYHQEGDSGVHWYLRFK